jgi:hypothetical protein
MDDAPEDIKTAHKARFVLLVPLASTIALACANSGWWLIGSAVFGWLVYSAHSTVIDWWQHR